MKVRIITGVVAFCLLVPFIVFSDGFLWNVAVAIISAVCMFEILCCIKMLDVLPLSIPALAYSLVLPLICQGSFRTLYNATIIFVFLMFVIAVLSRNRYHTSQVTLIAGLAVFAVNALTGMVMLRRQECGLFLLILVFLCAWGSDIGGYCVGRLFGTKQLAPILSPKKTVEGAIGAVLTSVLFCVLFGLICNAFSFVRADVWLLALTGALASVFAQFGDLAASLMKRHYSIKDFGTVFPGHGGMMDRFDSVIGVCVFLVFFTGRPDLLALFLPAV